MSSSIARKSHDFSVPPSNVQVTSYCWGNVAFFSSQQLVLAWSLVAVLCTVWSVLCWTPGVCFAFASSCYILHSREARISGLYVLGRQTSKLVANLGLEPSLHWKLFSCRHLFPALRFRHYLAVRNHLQSKVCSALLQSRTISLYKPLGCEKLAWIRKPKSHWNTGQKKCCNPQCLLMRSSCLTWQYIPSRGEGLFALISL